MKGATLQLGMGFSSISAAILVVIMMGLLPASGHGDTSPNSELIDSAPKVVAVQDRGFFLNKELTFQVGYLPLDSFTKYLAFGGGYTHYFSDFFGWEVVQGAYASPIPTGLEID